LTLMYKKWSPNIFLKVFGAVFLFALEATASQYDRALEAAQRAFIIQSGIKREVDERRRQVLIKTKEFLKEQQALEEAAMIGGILQIVKERGLSIKYEGVDYIITPVQLRVIIYL
jgi:hypothetical protein